MVRSLATRNRFWFGITISVCDELLKLGDAAFGGAHALVAFEGERLGHDADGQDAHLAHRAGDYRRSAGARAAAHAGGDEHHVRTGKLFHDLVEGFFGAAAADVGLRTRTQAFGELAAELDLAFSLGLSEGLRVGVGDDETRRLRAWPRSCC